MVLVEEHRDKMYKNILDVTKGVKFIPQYSRVRSSSIRRVSSKSSSTCPGRGLGTGSGLIQFSQVFFSSLKGPSITLLMSERLKTHTAASSSRSLGPRQRERERRQSF